MELLIRKFAGDGVTRNFDLAALVDEEQGVKAFVDGIGMTSRYAIDGAEIAFEFAPPAPFIENGTNVIIAFQGRAI